MLIGVKNKGQVSLFVILAMVLVGLFLIVYGFRYFSGNNHVPASIQPAYNSFIGCLKGDVSSGISLMESEGGYIYLPELEPGSRDVPFSSQLNFLGEPIPYWNYLSAGGSWKNQIPSKTLMESQLAKFVDEKISNCNLSEYSSQGFLIRRGTPKTEISLNKNSVNVLLEMDLTFKKGNDSAEIKQTKLEVSSSLGGLYASAISLYNYEENSSFLENYTIDVLRSYAPVDGVAITCSPKIWNAEKIFTNLKSALTNNIISLKTKGGNYQLANEEDKYFVVDSSVDARFLTSENWTNAFEVLPSKGPLLIAQPVGNQQGLGILGFCYVPYHFVYNIKYPVLVQVMEKGETFQFPLAVVIQRNEPRSAKNGTVIPQKSFDFCKYENTPITVKTFDNGLNPVDANISYECGGSSCELGSTKNGVLLTNASQCMNGYISTSAKGFLDSSTIYSNINSGEVDIILNRTYERKIQLYLDGKEYSGPALITFTSPKLSDTIVEPQEETAKLTSGEYKIQVYIFKNTTLKIGESTKQECVEVPRSGVLGAFGLTSKKCYNINLPAQTLTRVLVGGGTTRNYLLNSKLQNSQEIELKVTSLPMVNSLEQLQKNYVIWKYKNIGVSFK